ncbi:MAG: adenylate/guanylate cyclase domain-containing protein [Thermoleophilia bacterium]|nr:adenylate/guanylate cyclase domain-containing protein [Thermoleophilia bacterium]
MQLPETRYASSGEVSIAYQVLGEGSLDLVVVPGMAGNVEYEWHDRYQAAFRRRLARFSRLILFDKRGTGLSDGVHGVPTLEERMDDVRAVMDAVGSQRAVIMGISEGAAMTVLFASTYPGRTVGAILLGAYASSRADPDRLERAIADYRARWGTRALADEDIRVYGPSALRDDEIRRWWPSWIRFSATPGAFAALMRMNARIDVRHVLPAIRVPTLVLHRTGDRPVPVERGREVAEAIPGARWIELPGSDHYPWLGDVEPLATAVEEFVADLAVEAELNRVLATVLFTDVVGATERAAALGDREWRRLLESHHDVVRAHLARFRGREVDTAGDGFLATFDGPARAVRCGVAVAEAVRELGLEVRVGLHTGECELIADKVGGLAVHIGARIAALAGPGEVLVSATVRDLVAGSGLSFADRGAVELKGVPGQWRLYTVEQ